MYRKTQGKSGFIRISDGANIPEDINNTDYQKVLAWLEDGNSPDITEPLEVGYEAKRQYAYADETDSVSVINTMLDMIEAIAIEIEARGEGVTAGFRKLIAMKNRVNDKVKRNPKK